MALYDPLRLIIIAIVHTTLCRAVGLVYTVALEACQRVTARAAQAYGWNLFCQEGWPVLLECQRRGVAVHVAGVFRYIYNGGEDPARARCARGSRRQRSRVDVHVQGSQRLRGGAGR